MGDRQQGRPPRRGLSRVLRFELLNYVRPVTVLQAFGYALGAVVFGLALNLALNTVTGGSLPAPLAPYAPLAWPALGVMLLISLVASFIERLQHHATRSDARATHRLLAQPHEPRELLPPDIPEFTGRRRDLQALRTLVPAPEDRPSAPTIITLYGPPGTGKSVLALHFAYEMRARYPDAQLYVNLQSGSGRPLQAVEALTYLLHGLAPPNLNLPDDLDGLTREYAGHLRGRRALIVLDNAAREEQVSPLLPRSATCLVLITSRNQLSGLTSSAALKLGIMTRADAVALLARIAGDQFLPADEPAAAQLASLCGDLPLALSIVGSQLRKRPIRDVVARLEDLSGRMGELQAVRASFDITYERLDDRERTLFRRLRLLPELTFGAEAAAALIGSTPAQAAEALDRLVDEQVLERVIDGRYGFTDLIGQYASEKLELDEPQQERLAASGRALHYYLDQALRQGALVDSALLGVIDGTGSQPSAVSLDEQVAALDWFERERPKLVIVWRKALEVGAHDVTWKLAASMLPFFELRGHCADWAEVQLAALKAARASGDLYGQVWSWLGAGHLRWREGRFDEARFHLVEAVESAGAGGWLRLQARALYLIGCVEHDAGRLEAALGCFTRAAEIYGEQGLPHEQTSTVFFLADAMHEQGDVSLRKAMRLGESALADLAGRPQELWVVRTVGGIKERLGHVAEAVGDLERAGTYYIGSHDAFRRIGFKHARARVLRELGRIRLGQRSWSNARDFLEESAELFRSIGDGDQEATSRQLLAGLAEPPVAPAS